MSMESVIPSNHFILCFPFSSCTQSFPASESSPMCQLFALGGQSIGHSLQKENHNHRKLTKMVTGITAFNEALSHAMRATQDGWVMVESFDKTWSTGEGDVKPLHYSCSKNSENSIKSIRRNYIIIWQTRILTQDVWLHEMAFDGTKPPLSPRSTYGKPQGPSSGICNTIVFIW